MDDDTELAWDACVRRETPLIPAPRSSPENE